MNSTSSLHAAARHAARRAQRGAGALAVTMLLLFATSLGVLYLNRGQVFEQRTSANQTRSTVALEAAEAGIEWATGMLNSPQGINAACGKDTGQESFRKQYVMTEWDAPTPTSDVKPANNVFPGCRITAAGLTCNCPAAPAVGAADVFANVGATPTASFTVRFETVKDPLAPLNDDTEAVRLTSWGCSPHTDTHCSHDNATNADAHAIVQVIVKLKPVLRAAPASPLTCGTSCVLGGSINVDNADPGTNGVLVNAGTTISTAPGVTMDTLPGQPAANAMIGADDSLHDLSSADPTCSNSNMFKAYFGSTIEDYAKSPMTKRLSCSSAADCESKLMAAYAENWRYFYFDTDLQLSGNRTLGSQREPVTLVTPNALKINGTWDIYGLIFSNSAEWNDLGTGSATIHGAQISCAAYKNNGNGTLTYDPDALKNARNLNALMVRVPGSWKDF